MSLGLAHARLLVCDDNGVFRRVLSRGLAAAGYAITMADDGPAAVWEFTESSDPCKEFDVVIMDYSLRHGMTGGEAVNQIRKLCPDQLVIFLTGHELPDDITKHEVCLQKPAPLEKVIETIEDMLAARALAQRQRADTEPPGPPDPEAPTNPLASKKPLADE